MMLMNVTGCGIVSVAFMNIGKKLVMFVAMLKDQYTWKNLLLLSVSQDKSLYLV